MITQKVRTEVGTMIADCSKGDVAIGAILLSEKKEVAITLSNLNKPQEIGSKVESQDCANMPFVMTFDNLKSLGSLKAAVDKCVEMLEESQKKPEKPKFHVNYKNIFVTSSFRGSNPHPQKMMECFDNYKKTGKIDREIEVTKNLVIKDGYVGYLVAGFSGMNELEVIAPDGIEIKVGGSVIRFYSDEIEVAYGMTCESNFSVIIKVGNETYKIPAKDPNEASNILAGIAKVFKPKFYITRPSTMNIALSNQLEADGIKCEKRF